MARQAKHMNKQKLSFQNIFYRVTGVVLILTLFSLWLVCGLFAKYRVSGNIDDDARVAKTGVVAFELLEHEAVLDNGIYVLKHKVEKDEETDADPDDEPEPDTDPDGEPEADSDADDEPVYEYNKEVKKNRYEKVIPGVDIAKDPFVRLKLENSEVDYYLYLRVIEKDIPTYEVEVEDEENEDEEIEGEENEGEEIEGEEKEGEVKTETRKAVTYAVREEYWTLIESLSFPDKGIYVYRYNDYIDAGKFDKDIEILRNNRLYVSEHYVGNGEFSLEFETWLRQVD